MILETSSSIIRTAPPATFVVTNTNDTGAGSLMKLADHFNDGRTGVAELCRAVNDNRTGDARWQQHRSGPFDPQARH